MRSSIFCAIAVTAAAVFPLHTARADAPPISLLKDARSTLAPAKSLALQFKLPRARNLALQIRFHDAAFSGTTILPRVNGRALLPYHAFGGDTRYDSVKNKPGMHPPVAKIEANYVLPEKWLRGGINYLAINNSGPGAAIVESITLRDVGGHNLPRYENPIYFDFDVWRQGLTLRPGTSWYLDTMFLGIIPGSGNYVMNYSGGDGLPLKMGAEEARLGWGFKHSHFYAIWHLVNTSKQWAHFIDVDNNKETTSRIHTQFADPNSVPPGTDIALIDPQKMFDVLKPGIDGLLPYSTYYNISCEQWGPRGQGFTGRSETRDDRLEEKWAAQGYDFKRWANNYQEAYSKLGKYIHEKNPGAPILSTHWWAPDIRLPMYDTALERGYPMRDMVDAMMSHYYSTPYIDYGADGKPMLATNPERQYPGGKFDKDSEFWKWRQYMGTWLQIPEFAIDFNRYRLSRTEKDILPAVKQQNPQAGYWSNGKPIRHTAGYDGDEFIYNNETAIYDRNYYGPSPYQFLYSHFSYSLLPSSDHEDTEFKVTRTLPLDPDEKPSDDIFSEVDIPINRYGNWETGAAHTHRLRTRDPLYGDMFGYTGFEYGNSGDYIWLSGLKERYHRREPYNSQNLVRRTCYAFVTSGDVFPATVNDVDTNQLFVKSLAIKQNFQDVIGLYAVNFDDKPHTLDVTLPVGWNEAVTAQVFDNNAAGWHDAREQKLTPQNGEIRYKVEVPPRAPWAIFIYPPTLRAFEGIGGLSTPQPLGPWGNGNVTGEPVFRWKASNVYPGYEIQIAREMLFRPQDNVRSSFGLTSPSGRIRIEDSIMTYGRKDLRLEPNRRYHWRVRIFDMNGNSSSWSRPQSFWYQAENPGAQPTGDAPLQESIPPRAEAQPELKPFTDADNLAHTGHPFALGNYWEGAGEAVDGFAGSAWIAWGRDYDARKTASPAWWAVRFDKEETVSEARVLWNEKMLGKDFEVQSWDGKGWSTLKAIKGNSTTLSEIKLDAPVSTRALRILITAPAETDIGIAEIYIH